jgi:hypothetical protein
MKFVIYFQLILHIKMFIIVFNHIWHVKINAYDYF